jgi:hypothetical protein
MELVNPQGALDRDALDKLITIRDHNPPEPTSRP